eukprot:GFUD01032749.1.p1 GENE.GFUD01032749.1~~GFUD01032749.1.p1  ORF type:complete len:474 (-),score=77.39 GFUD01032749.1:115-1536(-)
MIIIDKDIQILPVEVLEEIFSHVNDRDVVSAAYVSLQWNDVCQRVARRRCAYKVPQDILTEILSEQRWGVVDWVEVWGCWIGSKIKIGMEENSEPPKLVKLPQQMTATVIDGSFVYSGNDDGTLEVRDVSKKNFVIRTHTNDGKVHSICLVKSFDLVLVAGEKCLHFFRINFLGRTWDKLQPDFSLDLGQNKHLSVFGPRFCASDNEKVINVYEIFYAGETVRTTRICEVTQELSWVQWKLWREKIIGMQMNGEIVVYSLLGQKGELMYKSEPYTVVMYKNPSWIFRDIVFCSTLASRGLTNSNYGPHTYVYMSDRWGTRNGTGYWMVGPVDDLSDKSFLHDNDIDMDEVITAYTSASQFETLMRGFCLKKIYPGLSTADDVTCIVLKRRLVLCGTNCGALIVFSADQEDSESASKHSRIEFDSKPLAKMKISMEPIVKVDIGFTDSEILLYYKTYTEDLSCISLQSEMSFGK